MEASVLRRCSPTTSDDVHEAEFMDVKKGPWTAEEDTLLMNYVSTYGEGRWNSVACHAGLKRTGKSCRLRWLNYLRPDLRHGNMTLQEQLLILELHARWGNRWSKIAEYLPGRTDNEIKNYWRTRVQKQAKQLKCDVNSKQFRDAMQHVWMPRLRERIQSSSSKTALEQPTEATTNTVYTTSIVGSPSWDHTTYVEYTSFDPSLVPEVLAVSPGSYSDNTQASLVSHPCERYDLTDGSCTESVLYGYSSWHGNTFEDYTADLIMNNNLWNEENLRLLKQLFDD